MASPFYVLRAVHTDVQIGKEIRTTDEVARTQPGGFIFAKGINLTRWARSWGYEVLVDPTGEFTDERGVTVGEAADILGLPVPATQAMVDASKFDTYKHPEMPTIVLRKEQVDAVARQRQLAAEAVTQEIPTPPRGLMDPISGIVRHQKEN